MRSSHIPSRPAFRTHRLTFALCVIFAFALFGSAAAYVLQTDRNSQGRVVHIKWAESTARGGIPYRLSTSTFPFPQNDILRIVDTSFGVWQAVTTSFISVQREATGTFRSSATDRRHVITYDTTGNEISAPRGSGVIAVTIISSDDDGRIIDCDIVFNGRDFRFSTNAGGPTGNLVDLQDVMTHEIGHFLGLDHTPLEGTANIRPTMNPFNDAVNPGEARTLQLDDEAGITTLYPSAEAAATGTISGRVLRADGTGSYGAHVIAYPAGSFQFAASALSGSVGTNAGPNGDGVYEISGLPPGDYQVAVQPVGGGITYQNFGGLFNRPFDAGFPAEYYSNVSIKSAAAILSLGSGRVLTDIDFAYGTADPGAPFLTDFDFPVNTPDTFGPYRVQMHISDDKGVDGAEIAYSVNGGLTRTVSLRLESGDLYSADIPGQSAGAVIDYRLSASDFDGNIVSLPATELPPFRFEVLELSGDPLLYIALRRSQEIAVIDTGPEAEVARIPTGEDPLSVALTPDGRYLFVTNSGFQTDLSDNRVSVVETATHRIVRQIAVGQSPLDLAVSAAGDRVYVSNSGERTISVIDVNRLEELKKLPAPVAGDGPFGIALSADGDIVYVTDSDGAQVLAIDSGSGVLLHRLSVVASPRSLSLSPDGSRLYVSGFDGGITVIDARSHTVLRSIDTSPAGSVFRLAPSPDGRLLYATDWFGANLLLIDLQTGLLADLLAVPSGGRNTRDLSLSSDGSIIYVANQDSNDLIFFDAATRQVIHQMTLADGPRGIAFRESPPGVRLPSTASAQFDFDGSGRIDFSDFLLFAAAFGARSGQTRYERRFDLNLSGIVDFDDFLAFAANFGRSVV